MRRKATVIKPGDVAAFAAPAPWPVGSPLKWEVPGSSYESAPVYYVNRHHFPHDRRGAWGDADRDGAPNSYDRPPNNPHRR